MGEKAKALASLERALALTRKGQDQRYEAYTLNYLGRVHERAGEKEEARSCYERALPLNHVASDPAGESLTLFNLAHLERDFGNLTAARERISGAHEIIESLRTKSTSQDLRSAYFATVRGHYELYIDILMQLHEKSPTQGFDARAFQESEQARARSLLESLSEGRADIREGVDSALLEKEHRLQQTLNVKAERYAQLKGNRSVGGETRAIEREVDQFTIEYDEVKAQIRSQSPRYAALTQPQPLTLKEIQQRLLDDNTLLLEYMLGDERSYVWVVTRTGLSSHELPGRAEIEKAAHSYYELMTAKQPRPGETFQEGQARAQQAEQQLAGETASLSKLLLAPLAHELGTKRLLIVADGGLQYIPFQSLTVPFGTVGHDSIANAGSGEPRPLVLDHEIIYEPSASTLALVLSESASRKAAPNSVAVVADPVFDVADTRIKSPNPGAMQAAVTAPPNGEVTRALRDVGVDDGEIPRLLSSREEAEAIMSVVPWRSGFKAVDFQANRGTVLGTDLGQYRIVHFATHALLNNEHPELSGIVLSLVDQKGERQDGYLRLQDIYNLKLPVDLVVLSACQTGLGKDVRGEGLIGLTRGFMYAGASGVVASLWKVDDEATAELMKHFYQGMFEQGLSPAAALREAQLALRQQKRWHEPYYWAGFVIQGQYAAKTSMKQTRTVEWLTALAGVGAALSLAIIFLLRRRRRSNL